MEMAIQPQCRQVVCDGLRRIPPARSWYLGNEEMEEADDVHHLLRMVSLSCTTELGEVHSLHSTSWGLGLGAYTVLDPIDSTLCLLIMLYGSELWSLTNTELNIFERTHRKILRTIQGLPTRCPTTALQSLIGSRSI